MRYCRPTSEIDCAVESFAGQCPRTSFLEHVLEVLGVGLLTLGQLLKCLEILRGDVGPRLEHFGAKRDDCVVGRADGGLGRYFDSPARLASAYGSLNDAHAST